MTLFWQLHNEEVRAFIDKVATMLTAKYPESVKNIVEKFSPSKGQRNQILVNELKWKVFYYFHRDNQFNFASWLNKSLLLGDEFSLSSYR